MLGNSSNLPTVQRLKFEDYARDQNWKDAVRDLVNSLNLFMTPVYGILNGGVSYQNLTVPQLFTKTITASATTTFSFTNPLPISPSALVLGNVYQTGNTSTHPASVCQVMWHYSGNTIYIDNVIGLTSGTQYTLTLVVF